MAVSYTTADFLTSVRYRGNIPLTTNTSNVNNTANLLLMATEELLIKLVPLILAAREEFFVTPNDYTIANGTAKYALPARVLGQVVRDVHIINGTSVLRLKPMESEYITTTATGDVLGYYFENNNIVLYPTPGSSSIGTLRVRYFRRPSQLEQTANCAQITAISGTTITVNSAPTSWVNGTVVDFIRATAPYDNQAVDQSISTISGTTLTFASVPTDLAVNDWIALAEYTPIPQVPREFQPVLAQMTVVKVLQAQGDAQGAAIAGKDLELLKANALSLITQRNEGENHKIINRNWYHR